MDELTHLLKRHTVAPIPSTNLGGKPSTAQTQSASTPAAATQTTPQQAATQAPKQAHAQAPKIEALVQQLQHTPEITAKVSHVQPLDSKLQQQLAKLNPELSLTINKQAQTQSSNVANSTISSSHTQGLAGQVSSNTATAPSTLYLVKLSQALNGQNLLTTVTPTPFNVGDELKLQLNSQQNIVIKPSVASVRPALIESLKTVLSSQQSSSTLLNTLNALAKLPPQQQSLLINPQTGKQLESLSNQIHHQQNLQTPTQIKTAISNSGVLTEQKIQSQQPLQSDLRTQLVKLIDSLATELPQQTSQAKTPTDTQPQRIIELVIAQLLSSTVATTSGAQPSAENNQQALTSLLQLLGIKSSQHGLQDSKKVKEAIALKISQLASGTQDKIHLNQLRSLLTEQGSNDGSSKPLSLTTEIPLRWGEQVLPLQLSIKEHRGYNEHREQQEEAQEENDEKQKSSMTRRWQVFLSFDLPSQQNDAIEQLHTQLTIIDNAVSATLWSDSASLYQKAQEQLQTLRQQLIAKGLQVDDLHCINGQPPKQTLSLDYNLVDITT